MRRRFYHIILLLALSLLPSVSAKAQLLYEIYGNGALDKSYLLATNRLMDITFLDTIPNVFASYGRCDKVITEFAMKDYEALQALRQAALLPDSIKLSNFYTEEEYKQIDEALRITVSMGLDKLCRMKPSYLTEMYRTELLRRWLDYDEERSMEKFFETVAEQNGTPVYGLDEIGETMYMLFDREPFHWQCKELQQIIEYPEREVNLERSIYHMYENGLLADIAFAISGPDNLSTLSYSDYQVYAQRNQQWVKRLAPYLKEGRAFITLDAKYIGGDKGLIAGLRNAGYRVRAANNSYTGKLKK